MLKLLFVIFFVNSLFMQEAYSQIPEKLSHLTKPVIQTIFTRQCFKYTKLSQSLQCVRFTNGKDGFFESLEFDIKKTKEHKEYIVFESELVQLMGLEKTKLYLQELKSRLIELEDFEDQSFSLWDFTLFYFDNNYPEALKNIAILFQDTHERLHIARLNRRLSEFSGVDHSALFLLAEINEMLSYESLNENKSYLQKRLTLFPINLSHSNASIYHFYTPAYISHKTSKNFPKLRNLARGLSFYLSVFYKTAHYYMGKWILVTDLPWITVDTKEDEHRVRDLYMSYKAVSWSQDKKSMNYEDFERSVERSIPALLSSVFR